MGTTRRVLLTALPKFLLSRSTGLVTRIPLPRFARRIAYGMFARRYGVELSEMKGELDDYRSLAEFFRRPLRDGQRPIADGPLVWPCDGKIITSGTHFRAIGTPKAMDKLKYGAQTLWTT